MWKETDSLVSILHTYLFVLENVWCNVARACTSACMSVTVARYSSFYPTKSLRVARVLWRRRGIASWVLL